MKKAFYSIQFNQWLSFSPLTAKISSGETVFWPGCAVLKLDCAHVGAGYSLLKKIIPEAGFSTLCCGKPTFAVLGNKRQDKRIGQLKNSFHKAGTKTIYTLCPNCRATLKTHFPDMNILSAWPIIAKGLDQGNFGRSPLQGNYILHDPCGDRFDDHSQNAVRLLLQKTAVSYREFSKNKQQTCCCGRKNMIFLTNPAASDKMRRSRLLEACGADIITYCESCVEAFRSKGKAAFHLLEIISGSRADRSVLNRFKAKKLIK